MNGDPKDLAITFVGGVALGIVAGFTTMLAGDFVAGTPGAFVLSGALTLESYTRGGGSLTKLPTSPLAAGLVVGMMTPSVALAFKKAKQNGTVQSSQG